MDQEKVSLERMTPGEGSGKMAEEAVEREAKTGMSRVSLQGLCHGSGLGHPQGRLEPTRVSPRAVSLKGLSGLNFEDFKGKSLMDLGGLLEDELMFLHQKCSLHSKSQPMGEGTHSLFPLPLSAVQDPGSSKGSFVRALCVGLNLLYGGPVDEKRESVAACRVNGVRLLENVVGEAEELNVSFGDISFENFFKSKGVDYAGEEVKVAQYFCWEAIEASFPSEVGKLELAQFCTMGVKHYVENFEAYLLPEELRQVPRAPRVMVADQHWEEVCKGLVASGVCGIMPVDDLFSIDGVPLLSGMFSVGKGEFKGKLEIQRLIMNLIPLNQNCRGVQGDVGTLPGISGLNAFLLEEGEVALLSSEDIRCFFYLFAVPSAWHRFLGFNKLVPASITPPCYKGRECVLFAKVLPMGFVNSVGIAQHVHRNVVRWAAAGMSPPVGGEGEMRRDKGHSWSPSLFRVYLDNFDQLQKVDRRLAGLLEGQPSAQTLALRAGYEHWGLPRHPKKAVISQSRAEIQGAIVDGKAGKAWPKPQKVAVYVALALELLRRGVATQREMQVVAGGFVYFAMFRRPLLCSLNGVWCFIESFKKLPPVVRMPIPDLVKLELVRFCSLIPLARMDFRVGFSPIVSASDASETGGGVCSSRGLTSYGRMAASAPVRGDIPEEHDFVTILAIGLFDGIGALRVACDALQLPMAGYIAVEKLSEARRVVESFFPDTLHVEDVATVDEEMVLQWACKYSNAGVILLGAGPPCQGVSGLNADKRGALKDSRSCLFVHVKRIRGLLVRAFPWAQVRMLMESVASMSSEDRSTMSESVQLHPWRFDAADVSLAHRPRLYWVDWQIISHPDVSMYPPGDNGWEAMGELKLSAQVEVAPYLLAGSCVNNTTQRLPTFTTARPSPDPGRKPAGLQYCTQEEVLRWQEDRHRFPPYQYRDQNLIRSKGSLRLPTPEEREVILGFPKGYTAPCLGKSARQGQSWEDLRCTLLGNSWNVTAVCFLLQSLFNVLGFCPLRSPTEIVELTKPGTSQRLEHILLRPPLGACPRTNQGGELALVRKLGGLVSVKGEDLLLQAPTENLVKFHRLRASVPGRLWKWRTVCGWQWQSHTDHINVLEMRAVLTSVKWRVLKGKLANRRFLHLTDSLVCLHALSRGRSSSRKLRRTLVKLNSYLLVANLHPVWGYIHTSQNPADRPSRRGVRRKWK